MFKQVLQAKMRYLTPKGMLNTEQLFDLSLTDLATTLKELKKNMKKSSTDNELDFIEQDSKDPENDLRFNILKDIYLTKKKALEDLKTAAEKKLYNDKIYNLIAAKKEEALNNKPIEELEKMLLK